MQAAVTWELVRQLNYVCEELTKLLNIFHLKTRLYTRQKLNVAVRVIICRLSIYTDALLVPSKVTGLEINVGRTNYVVMSCDQNTGQIHIIKIDNKLLELVANFRY